MASGAATCPTSGTLGVGAVLSGGNSGLVHKSDPANPWRDTTTAASGQKTSAIVAEERREIIAHHITPAGNDDYEVYVDLPPQGETARTTATEAVP